MALYTRIPHRASGAGKPPGRDALSTQICSTSRDCGGHRNFRSSSMTLAGGPGMILCVESVVTLDTDDAGEMLTLQRAAYVTEAQAHRDLDLPPLAQSLEDLASELADPEVLALGLRHHGRRLVAAVRVRVRAAAPTVAEVGRLTVAPDRQRQGLGSRLLGVVERHLATDVAEIQLFTGERSPGNLRLYSRLGYAETHRTPTPAGYALVHLTKPLSPRPLTRPDTDQPARDNA
jgi:GNAT superfamily N-acetyltransferase